MSVDVILLIPFGFCFRSLVKRLNFCFTVDRLSVWLLNIDPYFIYNEYENKFNNDQNSGVHDDILYYEIVHSNHFGKKRFHGAARITEDS